MGGHMWGGSSWGPMGVGLGSMIFLGPLVAIGLIWTIYWKYHAIWYAVKHEEKWWFLAFLVINTLGILEILYLYYFSKFHKNQ